MTKVFVVLAVAITAGAGCSKGEAALEVSQGSEVTVQKKDGGTVAGRVVDVKPNQLVVETPTGEKTQVARTEIANVRADVKLPDPAPESPGAETPKDEYREVTIPAGTLLPVELQTAVASDTSHVEDPVRGTLRRAVTVDGVQVLPAGTALLGHVTSAERSGRVKGRARIAFRFTRLDPPGDAERLTIQTGAISRVAQATKKQDAAKIGGGAAGGAIIGSILGGGDGAAKGAAIGGAAGTGVVLATRGKEVRLGPGADVSVRIASPVTLRVAAQ